MLDNQILSYLYSNDLVSIKSLLDQYPFYIGRKVFPLLIKHRSNLPRQLVEDIFKYVQTFYSHEKLFSDTHEPFTKKTAIINIHNRYH